jgi:hypothetical protein
LSDKNEISFLVENEIINRLCNLKLYLNQEFGAGIDFKLNLDLPILNDLSNLLTSFSQQLGEELDELTKPLLLQLQLTLTKSDIHLAEAEYYLLF